MPGAAERANIGCMLRLTTPALLASALCACAALGGGGGGGENLPNRGIVPWERFVRPTADGLAHDWYVLAPEAGSGERWLAPSALVVDAQEVQLFFEIRRDEGPSTIARAISGPEGLSFGPVETVFDPALAGSAPPWLGDLPAAPSVVRYRGTWLMALGYGDGEGIALAWSLDGDRFFALPEPALTRLGGAEAGGVFSPALVAGDEGVTLYYEARAADGGGSIRKAAADWSLQLQRAGVVLQAGVGCTGPDGQPESCWDASGVGSPEVRLAVSGAGTPVHRLFYAGGTGGKADLGFAAAWDGALWSRYAFNPVLEDGFDQREPTNVRLGDRYLLYFAEQRTTSSHGIAAAVNDAGHATELF